MLIHLHSKETDKLFVVNTDYIVTICDDSPMPGAILIIFGYEGPVEVEESVACLLGIVCMLAVGKVMLPTTKELILIKVLPEVVNSKFVQEDLPSDIRKLYTAAVQSTLNTLTGSQQNTKKGKEDADH